MKTYLFAYGSLMNPKSLARTLPGERTSRKATLMGYRRKMNAPFDGYAYLNIVPDESASVEGVLIAITREELDLFTSREEGYTITDVSNQMKAPIDGVVCAFIAPDVPCTLRVPRSYILTCTAGMTDTKRARWLSETEFLEVLEDSDNPVYEFTG